MSYTVDIVSGPVPASDREAWKVLEPLREELYADSGGPSDEMRTLHDRLISRFPCISVDEAGPWTDGPLISNFGKRMVILGFVYSRVPEVLPFVIETALDTGKMSTSTGLATAQATGDPNCRHYLAYGERSSCLRSSGSCLRSSLYGVLWSRGELHAAQQRDAADKVRV